MTIRLCDDVSTAETDDGMVLLDERAGRYWQLNLTGARVLRLLLDGTASHQVAETLAIQHGLSTEQVAADIAALLEQLHIARLVTDHGTGHS